MSCRRALLAIVLAGACLAVPGALRAEPATVSTAETDTIGALYEKAGELYAEQRYRESIPYFMRVIELDPRHGNAYALLGGAYFQLGDYPRAINAFERAIQLDEGIKLAYLGLVAANYLSERIESAQEWVRRLVPLLTGEERDRYLTMIHTQFPLLDL